MSQREARARARRFRPFKMLKGNRLFQQAVLVLRTQTGASPQTRRDREQAILRKMRELGRQPPSAPVVADWALTYSIMPFIDGHSDWDDQTAEPVWKSEGPNLAWRHLLDGQLEQLRRAGLNVAVRELRTAVFVDYDGTEFEMWAQEAIEGAAYQAIEYFGRDRYERHKNRPLGSIIKPDSIYLDVTDLHISQVEELWPRIEAWQTLLKTKPPSPKRGKPPGVPERRETALGKTWEEVRAEIKEAPSYYTRWENRYVDAEVGRREKKWLAKQRGATDVDDRRRRHWKRQAKDNFYHQVIVHPSMRDLNLRPRQKGRPRKN